MFLFQGLSFDILEKKGKIGGGGTNLIIFQECQIDWVVWIAFVYFLVWGVSTDCRFWGVSMDLVVLWCFSGLSGLTIEWSMLFNELGGLGVSVN